VDRDVVIFGGGAAGLWLLDELTRRGLSAVLLEANALGTGQTIAAQGIIHGGLKYTLQGLLTKSAASIREMPSIWRECLDGRSQPDLSNVRRRSDECFLWRTDSLSSRLGMLGAQFGLRVAPQTVDRDDRPELLRGCPGTVARLPEQVISTVSLMEVLAAGHDERMLKVDPSQVEFICREAGDVILIRLCRNNGDIVELRPRQVVFTAGAGNSALRRRVQLHQETMQRRPLHMVMLRGSLPTFQGHCVDGAKTRVTITSDVDSVGRTVWQVGGQIAEEGVAWDELTLLANARQELIRVLPGIDLSSVEWSTYRVDRAEGIMPGGKRPETVQIRREGNSLTAWPTKLALVPQLVAELADELVEHVSNVLASGGDLKTGSDEHNSPLESLPDDWPRPGVARPPWETAECWHTDAEVAISAVRVSPQTLLPKAA
jgi:glycerol-3-phosphate dehydrogenase